MSETTQQSITVSIYCNQFFLNMSRLALCALYSIC